MKNGATLSAPEIALSMSDAWPPPGKNAARKGPKKKRLNTAGNGIANYYAKVKRANMGRGKPFRPTPTKDRMNERKAALRAIIAEVAADVRPPSLLSSGGSRAGRDRQR